MFNAFVKQLVQTLNIADSNDKTTKELTLQIITVLTEMKNKSALLHPNHELHHLLEHIKECNINFNKLTKTENFNERLLSIANIYTYLGYIKAVLNAKLSIIDPLSKKTLKKKYCGEAKTLLQSMGQCYVLQNKIYSNKEDTLHPYYSKIEDKIKELDGKNEKLEKYVAVRPANVLYNTVVSVSNSILSI